MALSPPPRRLFRLLAWGTVAERNVFKVQMAVIVVVITLLSLGSYHQRQLLEIDRRQNLERVVHVWDGLAWYIWLLAAPATLYLIRRYPVVREKMISRLAALALGGVVIYLVIANLRYLLRMLPNLWLPDNLDRPLSWANYLDTQGVLLPIDFLTYCAFFATSYAIDYAFKYRQRTDEVLRLRLHTAQLQAELGRAQLAALRGQLNPHFLFNVFNAIATLVRQQKNDFAVEMITRLSELFRLTMENIDEPELTLDREVDFIRRYLGVERVRFGDKLLVNLGVEPDARFGLVPNLLLQPLFENAIKHAISRRVSPGWIRLTGVRRGERLQLAVIDDGPDASPEMFPAGAGGIGLRNTRARLQHHYGEDFRLEIVRRLEGGTEVRLDLPWRERQAATGLAPFAEAVEA